MRRLETHTEFGSSVWDDSDDAPCIPVQVTIREGRPTASGAVKKVVTCELLPEDIEPVDGLSAFERTLLDYEGVDLRATPSCNFDDDLNKYKLG